MWIIDLLIWSLFDLVGYSVARLVLPVLSFGQVHVAPFDPGQKKFNWFGYKRDETGRILVGSAAAGEIGLVVCLICLAVLLFFIR
jgi:hypothetical protein